MALSKICKVDYENLTCKNEWTDPAGGDQAPTCLPVATHGSALLIHSHLVAFSAASLTAWMALFLAPPATPSQPRTLQSDHPAKSMQPTSMGS